MEKLSETAERVWKIISQSPYGKATYKDIMRITSLGKSKVYEALNELERKGFIEHKKPFWILKGINQDRHIVIKTEEPIPIQEALELMEKYPIKRIQQKKSLVQKLKELLSMEIDVP
jgi:alkylated DNA nucleotide flippase Atl1